MSTRDRSRRRRARHVRRALALALPLLALPAAVLGAFVWGGTGASPASGASAPGEVTPQTDASLPAKDVFMFGASPGEAPNETWGVGKLGSSNANPRWAIVRYARSPGASGAWSLAPQALDASGQPLAGFAPDESPLAGDVTNDGSGALLGTAPTGAGASRHEVLLVRAPGQPFQAALDPTLEAGEHLFKTGAAPQLAALEEGGGVAGALVVPVQLVEGGGEPHVLHWDGKAWSAEPVEVPAGAEGFRPLALAASSPGNAWLLARVSAAGVALFRRVGGGGAESWKPVSPAPGAPPGAPLEIGGEPINEPEGGKAQLLDVTAQGLWVDAEIDEHTLSATLFFEPSGEAAGQVGASWCAAGGCTYPLAEPLPKGASRSYAWTQAGTKYGQRVIAGLAEGVSLRLEAAASQPTFETVLALGSGSHQGESVGAQFGAAFSSPTEGWLGNDLLPVHLTTEPEAGMLETWPVPFRQPLLAVAAQPGAAVGSRSSEALAVGVEGEVARYVPAEGWKPEGLLNGSGGRETPELRSVAWPTPSRAYAVGTLGRQGQIWLWRGETGLWEQDPGTPVNFRGKPLAVAFDAGSPGRGYIVGQQGLLLRYGKTWTQEPPCEGGAPQPCLPFSAKTLTTTSFTSVAFAGSEAVVAFRVAHFVSNGESSEFSYSESGLLANDGSGWHIDAGAGEALAGDIPWAVAGLPDGGAALSAEAVGGGAPLILERQAPGAPWQATPQPYPGISLPGSLALFRENGALRAIGAGAEPSTIQVDSSPEAPAGAPPTFIEPYPLASESSGTAGAVLRQTATGWRDEEHELNDAGPSVGNYQGNDLVFKPDPIWAVLVDESGGEGWAVGGYVSETAAGRSDTADIARYPREAAAAPGVAPVTEATQPGRAVIALGGGAQCITACALRARARIGPDVWLKSAVATAGDSLHASDFVYMGPRVTSGRTEGPPEAPVPYARELTRYGRLLNEAAAEAGGLERVYAAASPSELEVGNGCPLLQAWSLFDEALGQALAGHGCAAGEEAGYYAFQAGAKGGVKVIVLDQSQGGTVDATEEGWLEARLAEARGAGQPAIVAGEALPDALTKLVLVRGGAAAYFFDDPEENVKLALKERAGPGGPSVPAYGSGTLGYVSAVSAETRDFRGASGFLLAEVPEKLGGGEVDVKLIPDVGQLALEAKDGTLLRRSHVAEFSALARRPLAGGASASAGSPENISYEYTPIPDNCEGEKCAAAIKPEYTFTSSNEEVAAFVERNERSAEAKAVLLDSKEAPVRSAGGKSGLLCAFNKGETTITVTAGGLSASLKVVVQAGSVRRPCGTTKLKNASFTPAPPPPPGPAPGGTPASSPLPLVPVPPPPAPAPAPAHAPAPFLFQPALGFAPFPAIVPPPLPTPNPSPPSGTSAVTSPVQAAQKEEDQEEATESVSNQAVAYRASEHDPAPAYLLGLIVLAAFAGASGIRRRRAGRGGVRIAPATVASERAVRGSGGRGWPGL